MSSQRPNIVLIMTDQQRADLCAREGYTLDTTPFLDTLAAGGTWFNRAYTAVPACLPARISMLTGRWPGATRVRHNSLRMRDLDTPAVPIYTEDLVDVVSAAGYRTAMCGKNHSHLRPDRLDYWSSYEHAAGHRRTDVTEQEAAFDAYLAGLHHSADYEPAPFPVECQGPYRAVRDAINWIDGLEDDPFFLWLSFAEPHNPYQVPAPYFDMFPPDELPSLRSAPDDWCRRGFKYAFTREIGERGFPDYEQQIPRARSNYHGMLRLIDDQVGRFVAFLDDSGIRENTVLVFVSDHGDFVGEYGLVRKGPEVPELLMRVPMLWNGPGITGESEPHPAHVSIIDIMPTICEAVGADLPEGVQGRSIWPLLTGGDYPQEEFASVYAEQGMGGLHFTDNTEVIDPADDGLLEVCSFDCLNSRSQSGFMRMLRKGDWKLDFDMQGRGQLYNLKEDPVELNNLYGSPGTIETERELLADLLAWCLRADDPLPWPNGRYRMKSDPRNWWANYR